MKQRQALPTERSRDRTSEQPGRRRQQGSTVQTMLASIFGLAPGMLLPFVLAVQLGSTSADAVLLATSMAMTLTNVGANCLEQHTVAAYGALIGRGRKPTARSWGAYRRRVSMVTGSVVLVGFLMLLAGYAHGLTGSRHGFLVASIPVVFVPLIAAQSALNSARTVALGYVSGTIWAQGARALVPMVTILLLDAEPLWVYSAAYALGELARMTILAGILRFALGRTQLEESTATLAPAGLALQMASMTVNQGGPVVDRTFLSRAPAGSVAAYDMADKFLFAAVQVIVSGLLLRRFGAWAVIGYHRREALAGVVRRDVGRQLLLAVPLALTAGAVLFLASGGAWLPPALETGARWGSLGVLSLPAAVLISSLGRVVVIAGRQTMLVGLTVLNLALNVILNFALFTSLGPIGIVVSSVAARFLTAAAYCLVIRSLLAVSTRGPGLVPVREGE